MLSLREAETIGVVPMPHVFSLVALCTTADDHQIAAAFGAKPGRQIAQRHHREKRYQRAVRYVELSTWLSYKRLVNQLFRNYPQLSLVQTPPVFEIAQVRLLLAINEQVQAVRPGCRLLFELHDARLLPLLPSSAVLVCNELAGCPPWNYAGRECWLGADDYLRQWRVFCELHTVGAKVLGATFDLAEVRMFYPRVVIGADLAEHRLPQAEPPNKRKIISLLNFRRYWENAIAAVGGEFDPQV